MIDSALVERRIDSLIARAGGRLACTTASAQALSEARAQLARWHKVLADAAAFLSLAAGEAGIQPRAMQ